MGDQNVVDYQTLLEIHHTFSHYRLTITPLLIELNQAVAVIHDTDSQRWVKIDTTLPALPAPAKTLIKQLLRGF